MASPSPEENEERLQEIMLALVEASRENPDLNPKEFVRDLTSKVLGITDEESAYLQAHGRVSHHFPSDDDYEHLWDLFDLGEKAFSVMVSQVRDLGEQDEDNQDAKRLEAWVEGYMIGVYMERMTQKTLKEDSDARVEQ